MGILFKTFRVSELNRVIAESVCKYVSNIR